MYLCMYTYIHISVRQEVLLFQFLEPHALSVSECECVCVCGVCAEEILLTPEEILIRPRVD